ncbi:MAG: Trk system potassium transporter TrkA, partial [Halobacteriaceae archaeon]
KVAADPFTIARVKSVSYLSTWESQPRAYGVDFMVCMDLLTAENIVRAIGLPAASDSDVFANNSIRMAEFPVAEESDFANKTVEAADQFDNLTFAGLVIGGETVIARGDTVIEPGAKLIVIGTPEGIQEFATAVHPDIDTAPPNQVLIVGGSRIGYHTARLLERRAPRTRLIEKDPERARHLAEQLSDTTVFEHDATDIEFLRGEQIENIDVVVTALESDEKNLLMAVLAKQLGAERTVAVVETGAYAGIFEAVGVDVAVNPRELIAEEIIRFTYDVPAEKISLIEEQQAQIFELEITSDSKFAGRQVKDIVEELSDPVAFGAITRDGDVIIPRGDTMINTGDHVVLFTAGNIESFKV